MKKQNIFGELKCLELNTFNIFNGGVTEQLTTVHFLMDKYNDGININLKDYYNLKSREIEVFDLIHTFLSQNAVFENTKEFLILTNRELYIVDDSEEVFYLITFTGLMLDGKFISLDSIHERFKFLITTLYVIYLRSNDTVVLRNLTDSFKEDFLLDSLNMIKEFAILFNCKVIILTNSMYHTNLIRNNLEYYENNLNVIEIIEDKYT